MSKFTDKIPHVFCPPAGFFLGRPTVHQPFQLKKLFIKMIDRSFFMIPVLIMADQFHRRDFRIVDLVIVLATVNEGPGNPHGPQRLQPVGILDVLSF